MCTRLSMRRYKTQRQRKPQGVALICVIVCLAVITMLIAGMFKRTLLTRRQLRTERNLRQAQWLAQAGAERAAFRLANDAEYSGEVWALAAESIVGSDPGVVSISVNHDATGYDAPDHDAMDRVTVQVTADYPSGNVASVRRTREFLIDLPKQ